MFQTLRNAWKILDIRKKLLFTLLILVIYRVGCAMPVPFLDSSALAGMISGDGNLLGFVNILSGGSFSQATVFALSIQPYITASIVMQLLTIAIPALERLAKEGDEGRKKIDRYTRYVAIGLAVLMSVGYYFMLRNQGAVKVTEGAAGIFSMICIIAIFTAGASIIIYLGSRIDEKGIGNGISMILFANIISGGPSAVNTLWSYIELANQGYTQYYVLVPLVVVLFLLVIAFIVFMTNAERRIPVQYAKKVVGRKMYGGQSTHIPIKVNMSGVMPIIFASSIVAIPGTIGAFVNPEVGSFWYNFFNMFSYNSWLYALIYFLLIIAFNYFYVAVQYNPVEIANNLRKNNGAIPGIRPGKPTSDFIARIVSRITLVGALFLGILAVLPIIFGALATMPGLAIGGTSIMIVVGVALETVRSLESMMMMRHYKGFLE